MIKNIFSQLNKSIYYTKPNYEYHINNSEKSMIEKYLFSRQESSHLEKISWSSLSKINKH